MTHAISAPRTAALGLTALFISLWTSGFVVGSVGARSAPPLALTFWRFLLATAALAVLAVVTRAPWPRTAPEWRRLAVTGLLLQAVQFSGVYLGMGLGVPAGLSALIMGSAPLFVAAGGVALLGERLTRRQWLGSLIGLAGVALAVADRLGDGKLGAGLGLTAIGMLGMAGGTLYQRRHGTDMDLRSGGAIQLGVSALAVLPLAALHGGLTIPATTGSLGSLAWLALVNSVGAISLLFFLLRGESAHGVTDLLYLVPPITALVSAPLLGQSLGAGAWLGLAVAATGVVVGRT